MKGLTLCAASFLGLALAVLVLLRFYRGKDYFKICLAGYLFALVSYSAGFILLPADLGFLPGRFLESLKPVDFFNGAFILTLLFQTFWNVSYAAFFTGFSANLMVTLFDAGEKGLSSSDYLRVYGIDSPLDRVMAWRVPSLVEGGYIAAETGGYRLLRKGKIVAAISSCLKKILDIRGGG